MPNEETVQQLYDAQPGGPLMRNYANWRISAALMRSAVQQIPLVKCQMEELAARHIQAVQSKIEHMRKNRAQVPASPAFEVPTPPPI